MTVSRFGALGGLLLLWSGSAMAAKNASVQAPTQGQGVVLRSAPDDSSDPVATLRDGEPVVISNYPTRGFYKARSASGQIGWIATTSVGPENPAANGIEQIPPPSAGLDEDIPPPAGPQASKASTSGAPPAALPATQPAQPALPGLPGLNDENIPYEDVRSQERTLPEPGENLRGPRNPFEIKLFGGLQVLEDVIAFNQLGIELYLSMAYYGLQVGVPVSDRIFLLLRLEHLSNSSSQAGYGFSLTSTPLTAGLSYSFLARNAAVRIQGSLLLGVALATTLDATATNQPAPNLSELETEAFTEMLKVDLGVPITSAFALYGEGGYRFLNSSSIGPSPAGNGASIFQQNGTNLPMPLNLSGLFVGAGLAFYL